MLKKHSRHIKAIFVLLAMIFSATASVSCQISRVAGAGDNIISMETNDMRLGLSPDATMRFLESKSLQKDYVLNKKVSVMVVKIDGIEYQSNRVTRRGDALVFEFPLPDVLVSVGYKSHRDHILFDIRDVRPTTIEELNMQFPVRRLQKVGAGFNGTYDGEFGICLFGATVNIRNIPYGPSGLRVAAYKQHGFVGAKFVLVAAPFSQFKEAIMDAERDSGIPCPILEGKWARESEAVRRSYLFVTDASEANIDKLIQYAKIANFGMILFNKKSIFKNHGHYEINKKNFPNGLSGLKQTVVKIHQAGLHAGVHVFGPSISPNDPYATPKPDNRLSFIPYPSLAHAIDEKTGILTLVEPPQVPRPGAERKAFPGRYLQIGDELIQCSEADKGPPFRYLGCKRGAAGTKVSPHTKTEKVKRLLALWDYFLVDPDSSIVDEMTQHFANLVNECDLDFVYFDASDGIDGDIIDAWYYLNKLHFAFYQKFKRDILYQTSNGPGSDLVWHMTPRAASADGHGDIKGYLDERWPEILRMETGLTKPDIGWYYWFENPQIDQIEYVCAKTLGINGSFSLETSVSALEKIPQSRQLFEIIGRYEACRKTNCLPESLRLMLLQPSKDFKLIMDTEGSWCLYRAVYEIARSINALDGKQNVWSVWNELPQPCLVGFEIAIVPSGPGAKISERGTPILSINGIPVEFPVDLKAGQVLTSEGAGEMKLWEGTMNEGRKIAVPDAHLLLRPGENRITFSWSSRDEFPGNVQVILYRLWPAV